jgi:hypothetical protein
MGPVEIILKRSLVIFVGMFSVLMLVLTGDFLFHSLTYVVELYLGETAARFAAVCYVLGVLSMMIATVTYFAGD